MNYLHARKDETPAPPLRPLPVLSGRISERKARSQIATEISTRAYFQAKQAKLAKKHRH